MIAGYVGRWSQAHNDQLELCARMDLIANRLPFRDVDAVATLGAQLEGVMSRAHAFEEEDLFPLLEAMSPHIRPLLVTFRSHHRKDRELAAEICNALCGAQAKQIDDLTHLKLQLDCFAETLRRHVEFEGAIAMALFAFKRVDEKRAVQ